MCFPYLTLTSFSCRRLYSAWGGARMKALIVFSIFFLLANFVQGSEDKSSASKKDLYLIAHSKFLGDQLSKRGISFFDPIAYEEFKPDLKGFQNAFKMQLGNSFHTAPSDREIVQNLQNLADTGELFFPDPELPLKDYKVAKQALQMQVPRINFIKKWQEITQSIDFFPDFYEEFYEVLSTREIIESAEFVDPTDFFLNSHFNSNKLKKDYLIILLASIKNPGNNKELNIGVKASKRTPAPFSTQGNSESWFAEKRYKLYRIWQKLTQMNDADKATLLSNFLHAGKHCSVAKRWQIDDSYKLFNYQDFVELQKEQKAMAKTLYEKVAMSLALEKEKILLRFIKNTYENHLQLAKHAEEYAGYSYSHYKSESSTFLDATWDVYAGFLGLERRQCPYPSYALELAEDEIFKPSSYNATRILNVIESEHGNEILDEVLGVLKFVIKDPNRFILGYLIHHGFIASPTSSQEIVSKLEKQEFGLSQYAGLLSDFYRNLLPNLPRTNRTLITEEEAPMTATPIESSNDENSPGSDLEIVLLVDSNSTILNLASRQGSRSRVSESNHTLWRRVSTYVRGILRAGISRAEDSSIDILIPVQSSESQGSYTYQRISREDQLESFFHEQRFQVSSPLGDVLSSIYQDHLSHRLGHTSVCIITDGMSNIPDLSHFLRDRHRNQDWGNASEVEPMNISVVRCGDDHEAANYLNQLDLELQEREADIVDIISENGEENDDVTSHLIEAALDD